MRARLGRWLDEAACWVTDAAMILVLVVIGAGCLGLILCYQAGLLAAAAAAEGAGALGRAFARKTGGGHG